LLRVLLPAGGALATGALGVAAYTAYVLNRPRRPDPLGGYSFTPWELQVPFEEVSFVTDDGVTIRGWWFPCPESDAVVVGFTGHKGVKQDLLGIGSALWRANNHVLLFDFRGCGESDLVPLSLAHHEMPDARAAVAFARARVPSARVGVIGYSMGGAIAVLLAAEDPSIAAVVSDSSFASISDVLAHAHARYRLPAPVTVRLADFINRWRYGYGFEAVRPVDAISALRDCPILLIHSAGDPLIPGGHAHRLYDAAPHPKELWIVDDPRHCGAYFHNRAEYVSRVCAFFREALAGRPAGAERTATSY
jgi:alpha-beta hydrolase superfamily lysophospholipase